MLFYLYILQSTIKETYYTGSSDDPDRRLFFHNNDSKGYTRRFRPWNLAYTKSFNTREQALRAERIVKAWKSKRMIRLLIEGKINLDDYL